MMTTLIRVALDIGESVELSLIAKATVLVAVALITVHLAARTRASMRHLILAAMFAGLAILPTSAMLLPSIPVGLPDRDISDSVQGLSGSAPSFELAPHELSIGQRPEGPMSQRRSVPSLATSLRVVWLIGATLVAAQILLSLYSTRQVLNVASRWIEGDALVDGLHDSSPRRPIRTLLSRSITAPVTLGFWRPAVILPAEAVSWSEPDIRNAIAHECEHARRGDWLIQLVARGICAMYWFHPLVWMARRRLGLFAELACDDAVLRSADRAQYADQLVRLARRLLHDNPRAALSLAGQSDLATRVRAALDNRLARGRVRPLGRMTTAIVSASLVFIVAALNVRANATPITTLLLKARPISSFVLVPRPAVLSLRGAIGGSRTEVGIQQTTQQAEVLTLQDARVSGGSVGLWSGPFVFGSNLIFQNAQFMWLLEWAYQVDHYHIVGAPSWAGPGPPDAIPSFDVVAVSGASASADGMRQMLRKVLVDRFRLATHLETRSTPTYALVIADPSGRLGPNIHPATTDCKTLMAAAMREGPKPNTFPCGNSAGPGQGSGRGLDIARLASIVSRDAGRQVVDKTGLAGIFDWDLTWTPEPLRHHAPDRFQSVDPEGPSIFSAVEQQLGLRLEPQDVTVEVLVVDYVEPPALEPAPALERPGLTVGNYLRLQAGMQYEEVAAILGQPGAETSRSAANDGSPMVAYSWPAAGPLPGINMVFRDGRLVGKMIPNLR